LIIIKSRLRNQFKDIFFTAKQKQVTLLVQDLVEICTLQTKLSSKFPIIPPENSLVVFGMEAISKNKFATSESFTLLENWRPKKRW
jgi:hypothetical protein